MTDLRDPVRDDLDAMFRRREGDVVGPASMPVSSRRRAHRRQAGTATLALAGLAAVVALTVAGVQAFDGDDRFVPTPREEHTRPVFERAATIEGFTVTSPSDWYLVDYWPVMGRAQEIKDGVKRGETMPGSEWIPGAAGVPVLQLTSYDPGLGAPICGSPTGDDPFPSDGVGLYIALDTASKVDPEEFIPWPNTLTVDPPACDGGTELRFGVRRGGQVVPYLLWYGAGPDASDADRARLDAIVDALAVDADQPEIRIPGTDTPGFVLWGGTNADGSTWTIEARPTDVNVDLMLVTRETDGTYSGGGVADFGVPPKDVEGGFMGVVIEEAVRVEFVPSDGSTPAVAELIDLPPSLGFDADAYRFADGYPMKDDPADGKVVAVMPTAPIPTPTDDGTVVPTPVGPLPGELARGTWMDGSWLLSAEPGALTLRDAEYGDILAIVPWAEAEEGAVAVQTVTADLEGRIETVIFGTVASDAPHLGLTGDGAIHVPVLRSALPDRAGRDYFLAIVPEASGGAVLSATADGCEDPTVSTWVARGIGAGTPSAPTDAERAAVCGLPLMDPAGETESRPRAALTSASVGGATPFESLVIDGETVFGEAYPNGEDTCVSTWSRHWGSALCILTEELFDVAPMIYLDMIDDANTVVVAGLGPAELHAVGVPTRDGQEILLTTALGEGWGDVRYVMGMAVLLEQRVPTLTYLDADGGDLYPPGTPQGGMGMSSSSDAP